MRSRFFVVVVLLLIVSEAFQAIAGVSTSNKVCGRPRRYSGLIIGGSNFTRGDFPWIVALMYKSMSSPKFICGGTIITTKHVITAAHCVQPKYGQGPFKELSPKNISVLFGAYDLNDNLESGRISITPLEIHVHQKWNPNVIRYDYDVAILEFEVQIPFSIYIHSICLWYDDTEPPQHEGYVAGWGKSENERAHETIPKYIKVPIQSEEECFLAASGLRELSSPQTFCAGTLEGIGVCFADSGNGFFVKVNDLFYLRGIVSSSLTTDTGCDVTNYAVYTDAIKFRIWINSIIKQASNEPTLVDSTEYLLIPRISSSTDFFATEGKEFSLTCHIENNGPYTALFLKDGHVLQSNENVTVSDLNFESKKGQKSFSLTVPHGFSARDAGDYKCAVQDDKNNTNSALATIIFVDAAIELNPSWSSKTVESKANKKKPVHFEIEYSAFPPATFQLFNPIKKQIALHSDVIERTKYSVQITAERYSFSVLDPDYNDFGDYTLTALNVGQNVSTTVKLVVNDKPNVTIEDVYVEAGHETNLNCKVIAYPKPEITWSFEPCAELSQWPSCGRYKPSDQLNQVFKRTQLLENVEIAEIKFIPSSPGSVRCHAENKLGSGIGSANVMRGDLAKPFMIIDKHEDRRIVEGDLIRLECGAIVYNYSNKIEWSKDDEPVEKSTNILVNYAKTKFSWRKSITLNPTTKSDSGTYKCEAYSKETGKVIDSEQVLIHVIEPQAPKIFSNFNEILVEQQIGDSITLTCQVSGIPDPNITWYKNGGIFASKDNATYEENIKQRMSIILNDLQLEDAGTYECLAKNRVGLDSETIKLKISNFRAQLMNATMFVVINIAVVISIFCCCLMCNKRKWKELEAAGLAYFETGNFQRLDPSLKLDEQAELLPYDKEKEFSRRKLKIKETLSVGSYGKVVKAVATRIVFYEKKLTVAVKVIKNQENNEMMKASVSELKTMIHVWQHINLVNLLGANTENIRKRELLLIMEYCRYGNLQDFLTKHRKYFVNQIRYGIIDPNIGSNEITNKNEPDVISANVNTGQQPSWRSSYGMECEVPARFICTSDLVCWSYQIARGMDYLASKNVVHGDLAARNVLLSDNNIVKICDLGMARSLYKNESHKKGKATMPIEWMALESISYHVFSTYTDIWSFGVVLWEIFSLGQVPSLTPERRKTYVYKLCDGFRMTKPVFSNQNIYELMLSCWRSKPQSRPSFKELENCLGLHLDENLRDHYVKLNEPNVVANERNYQAGKSDYFSQVSNSPDITKPLLPQSESNFLRLQSQKS